MRPQWEIDAIDRLDDAREARRKLFSRLKWDGVARLALVKVKKGRGQRRNRRNRRSAR